MTTKEKRKNGIRGSYNTRHDPYETHPDNCGICKGKIHHTYYDVGVVGSVVAWCEDCMDKWRIEHGGFDEIA